MTSNTKDCTVLFDSNNKILSFYCWSNIITRYQYIHFNINIILYFRIVTLSSIEEQKISLIIEILL